MAQSCFLIVGETVGRLNEGDKGVLLGLLVDVFVTGTGVGGGEGGASEMGLGVRGFGDGFGVTMLSRLTAKPSVVCLDMGDAVGRTVSEGDRGFLLGILVGVFVTGFGVGGGERGAFETGLGVFGFKDGFGVMMLSRLTAMPSGEPAPAEVTPNPATRNVMNLPLSPKPYIRSPVGVTVPP